jgi:hypothetical protein
MNSVIIVIVIAVVIVFVFFLLKKSPKTGKSIGDIIRSSLGGKKPRKTDCLYFSEVIDWFKEHRNLKEQNDANIAFSLMTKLPNGTVELVIGIFNKDSNEFLEGEKIIAGKVDSELEKAHAQNELVLYE